MPIDHIANERFAVFLVASRFNHACLPNAYHKWNEAIKRLTIHAQLANNSLTTCTQPQKLVAP